MMKGKNVDKRKRFKIKESLGKIPFIFRPVLFNY